MNMIYEHNNKPCIICVAITGSVPKKENNPNLPISVSEQIESAYKKETSRYTYSTVQSYIQFPFTVIGLKLQNSKIYV